MPPKTTRSRPSLADKSGVPEDYAFLEQKGPVEKEYVDELAQSEISELRETLAYKDKCIEDLTTKLQRGANVDKEKDETILRLERELTGLLETKSYICSIDGSGSVQVDFDGDWSYGELRRVIPMVQSALRANQIVKINAAKILEENKELEDIG